MPEKQDLINHRLTATACKNYTDKEIKASEERILSIVARNNVDFIDHINEPTYRFTAPSNSKLLMLQSIAGNSNKIAPSTPSDDSVARLKTIPENTYKSQIDYIGGKSVKYNQFCNITAGTTENNGITYTRNSNGTVSASGTATADSYLNVSDTITNISGHKCLIYGCASGGSSSSYFIRDGYVFGGQNYDMGNGTIITASANNVIQIFVANGTVISNAITFKPIFIDLTDIFGAGNEPSTVETAIPLLKANGYKLDGTDTYSAGELKHAVVSGVKYEAVNLLNIADRDSTTTSGITYKVENGVITLNGTATETAWVSLNLEQALPKGNYVFNAFNPATNNSILTWFRNINNEDYSYKYLTEVNSITTITDNSIKVFRFNITSGTTLNNFKIIPMIVRGTTAPSTYIPYVAPITKAIPSQVLALDGYGMGINDNLYNYIDFKAKKFIKKVGKLLGSSIMTLYKNAQSEEDWLYYFSIAGGNGATASNQIICNKLETKNSAPTGTTTGCSITSNYGGIFYVNLYGLIQTNDVATALAYIQANLEFIYPLPSVIEIDISQYLTTDFKVDLDKQYATCEMVCENPIDMPNKVEYYGTIIHSLATAVKQDGFNLWDEEWEVGSIDATTGENVVNSNCIRSKNYIPIISNASCYKYVGSTQKNLVFTFYDNNYNVVPYVKVNQDDADVYNNSADSINSKPTFVVPSGAIYMKFRTTQGGYGTTYNNDICINISNQDLNGTYKPYKAPITRLLPNNEAKYSWGITDGVRNTRVFCDDECNPVNEGQLDVANQDLGGIGYIADHSNHRFYGNVPNNKTFSVTEVGNIICSKYPTISVSSVVNGGFGIGITTSISISDIGYESLTASQFKTAMSGEILWYQKNATTPETLDDFDFSFDCEEGDTFTIIGCELLQCYATYSFLIKEARSNE